jgi:hypothetical protein
MQRQEAIQLYLLQTETRSFGYCHSYFPDIIPFHHGLILHRLLRHRQANSHYRAVDLRPLIASQLQPLS